MEEYYNSARPSRWARFVQLVVAALVGGLIVLGALPFLLPRMLPENGSEPNLPWNFEREAPEAPDLEHQQTAVVNAVNEVSPAVVGVTRISQSRDIFGRVSPPAPSGHGSGVIISPEGYVVTNYHVVEEAVAVVVTLSNGVEAEAEIVGVDPGTDLAVLKVQGEQPLPWARMGDSESLVVGEFVVAIGNPGGLQLERSVTFGVISGTDRRVEVYDWVFGLIQTSAAINPGNSGGPLVNMQGEVVGINSVKITDAEGLGFSIPSELVKGVSEELIEHGRVIRPMLGVTISEVTPLLADYYDLASDYGLLVAEVSPDGPAQQAGLRPDDIIIEADGSKIESLRDLRRKMSAKGVGDEVEVIVLRGDSSMTFSVVLADLEVD